MKKDRKIDIVIQIAEISWIWRQAIKFKRTLKEISSLLAFQACSMLKKILENENFITECISWEIYLRSETQANK
jgi:hypothetical protein